VVKKLFVLYNKSYIRPLTGHRQFILIKRLIDGSIYLFSDSLTDWWMSEWTDE
jgi:hypothetical protein